MSNLITFYIVRHGETEHNVNHIIQGHTDSPLTHNGVEKIKGVAKKLKGINFDYVFSSDLLRAKRSAEIIALEHKLAVQTSKLLRERCFGEFEGKKNTKYKIISDYLEQLTTQERYSFKTRGIESDKEIIERFTTFLREVAIANPSKIVLVVTHGALMRFFLIKLGIGDHKSLGYGSIENGAFIKLETDGIDFFIKELSGIHIAN